MTRQEFIDACIISMADSKYHSVPDLAWQTAVKLANERAKHCPFDDDKPESSKLKWNPTPNWEFPLKPVSEPDPYAVNWDDAPEWANWHAVDEDGEGYWYESSVYIDIEQWSEAKDGRLSSTAQFNSNPNWRESLRKRP